MSHHIVGTPRMRELTRWLHDKWIDLAARGSVKCSLTRSAVSSRSARSFSSDSGVFGPKKVAAAASFVRLENWANQVRTISSLNRER